MIYRLKNLVLALVVVSALSVVVASTASAAVGTLTSTGPVKLDIKNRTSIKGTNAFTASFPKQGASSTECPQAIYTGFKYNVTPHTFIPNDVSTFTATLEDGLCSATIGASTFPVTTDMNGCDFVFHLGETTPGVDTYSLSMTIFGCDTGKHITATVWKTAAEHNEGKAPFCAFTITEKSTDYTGLHATDTTEGDIKISGVLSGMVIHKTSPTGSILCPTETDENGKYDVDWTVTGTNEAGGATSIGVSHL